MRFPRKRTAFFFSLHMRMLFFVSSIASSYKNTTGSSRYKSLSTRYGQDGVPETASSPDGPMD